MKITRLPLFLASIFGAIIILANCQEPPPQKLEPYANTALHLEALQVNSIDAQLKLSLTDLDSVTTDTIPVILKRNGQIVKAFDFVPPDSTLWDETLEPSRTYSYKAYRQSVYNTSLIDSSNALSIATMDTTSHDFTWDVDTIGDWGSYFKDVTIINENNVWAVGEFKTGPPDTNTGNVYTEYNVAHWDGNDWSFQQILSGRTPGRGIRYFSDSNIWVVLGGFPFHWDGSGWTLYHLQHMGVTTGSCLKVWGLTPDDLYFVGINGTVVHYNGSEFTELVSNTDIKLTDVWGIQDNNGEVHVWACGSGDHNESIVLKITDQTVETIYERYVGGANSLDDETIMSPMGETLWATPTSPLLWITGGFGLVTFNDNQAPTNYSVIDVYRQYNWYPYTWKMRGTDKNDLFLAGEFGSLFHYNGKSWYLYQQLRNDGVRFWCMAASPHLVVIGGEDNSAFLRKGIIAIGRR